MLNNDFEVNRNTFKKFGSIVAFFDILFAGLANSFHSLTRWPTTSGTQAAYEFLYYSYTNPYAIICGVLFLLLIYQTSESFEEIRLRHYNIRLIILLIITFVWHYTIFNGILVY